MVLNHHYKKGAFAPFFVFYGSIVFINIEAVLKN